MNKNKWRLLQFVVNLLLAWWVMIMTQTLWVLLPISVIVLWNYVYGLFRPAGSRIWVVLEVMVNILFVWWVFSMVTNPWVLLPVILIALWNYLDGIVRKNW